MNAWGSRFFISGLSSLDALSVAGVIGLYAVLALLLPVGPDLPLGDSWMYARSAQTLVEEGRLVLSDGQSMSLVGQVLLAAPVAMAVSADLAVLNLFNFALSCMTAILFFLSYRTLQIPRVVALLGTGVLVANPIWLAQSVSFDTEISFLFFAALGLLAFLVWDRWGLRAAPWVAGAAFAGAVTVRQHGVVLGLAALGYAFAARRRRRTPIVPLLLPFVALLAFYAWLHWVHGLPKAFGWSQKVLMQRLGSPGALAQLVGLGSVEAAHYFGLFLLPLLPLVDGRGLPSARAHARRRVLAAVAVVLGLASVLAVLLFGLAMPSLPNVLTLEAAVAPFGIADPLVGFRLALTTVCWLAAVGALRAGLAVSEVRPASGPSREVLAFVAACGALLLGFTLVTGLFFDRYLLVVLPFLVPLVLPLATPARGRVLATVALLALELGFSIYYVDQRIRSALCEWTSAQALLQSTGDPHRIDAGTAFNGYYSYDWLSRTYGAGSGEPWLPGVNPGAALVLRPFALQDPRVQPLELRRCPNHPGLEPFEVHVYRRTIFGGPPLRTPQG